MSSTARKGAFARRETKKPGTFRRVRRNPQPTLAANVTEAVTQINWDGRAFHLREPIDLKVRHEHGKVIIEYPDIGIDGIGTDEHDALESFADDFAETWDSIAAAPYNKLTGDARDLKRRLRDLVAKIKPLE